MVRDCAELKRDCDRFVLWGCVVGIDAPFLLLLIWDVVCHDNAPGKQKILGGWLILLLILVCLAGTVGTYMAVSKLNSDQLTADDRLSKASTALYLVGVIVAALTGLVVVFTGGVLKSIFSYYLLYLPAVVAVAFARSRRGVILVSAMCLLMLGIGLLFEHETTGYTEFYGSPMHKCGLWAFSLFQVFVVVYLEFTERVRGGESVNGKERVEG